ncbi:hypothetical protein JCM11491_003489 [Sporobolomyces phaffii]
MRPSGRVYVGLALVRILIAASSRSVIHPDEHFQNPEVAAQLVFDYAPSGSLPLETWEWQTQQPCRSIAPLWISSALAFSLVGDNPSAETLFIAQRGVMLLLSFAIDVCIYAASKSLIALVLFASSPLALTFLIRPFSNSLETFLLAVSLYFTSRILSHDKALLVPLGALLALGVWTRITFAAFASPLVVAIALHLAPRTVAWSSLSSLVKRGSPAVVSFSLTAFILAIIDTRHFASSKSLADIVLHPSRLVVTPFNLLRYNVSHSNLAQHGLHPRYLHALVNLPMLFVLLASFIIPVALLSIQPHQEPRFLVPLVIPLVLLAPQVDFLRANRSNRATRHFWALWILHSAIFTAFFGYLHQGGLVPTLLRLNRELRAPESPMLAGIETVELVFWKTFMPPRHLVLPLTAKIDRACRRRNVSVTDLGSVSQAQMYSTLLAMAEPTTVRNSSSPSKTFIVSPSYLFDPLKFRVAGAEATTASGDPGLCFDRALVGGNGHFWFERGGTHVDMDRVGEMVEGYRTRGWNGLGMGVWEVRKCRE